ncbi:hypothetical protein DMC63_12945 [Streptomyces sp. WAC 05977]|uniref:Membrane protein YkgB n=1 Tax=Amycolatopsis roodepoortensis TaxID=700274 RepID=A0ABR9L5D2_9PSEU|nr:hypothetical protein [Amycolatopsis roodepoortensis]MBE1575796.1 putative membrane protein YkgB [Amycolatopsis roodepoortensis]RSN19994.1 hypothetical protein DMC63_12945 [Streptomyces sp. WAC 05977]
MSETEKTVEVEENPHAKVVLQAANAMTKASLIATPPVVLACIVLFTILNGLPGLYGSVIGGVLAILSSLATLGMMRFSAGMDPMFVMVIALGGYVLKILVLFGALTLLRGWSDLHPMSLGITMIAAILVSAAAEFAAFRKTKIPTIIPASR